jgi:hypothetical protein
MTKDLKPVLTLSLLPESKWIKAMSKTVPPSKIHYDFDEGRGVHALTHVNSVQIIPPNDREKDFPPLRRGNLLINDRKYDYTYIVDRKSGDIVWFNLHDTWGGTHSPRVLPNGNILYFVNNGFSSEGSSVAEFDPTMKKVVWSYRADAEHFLNRELGSAMPLCDGHVLVTHTTQGGAAFEVNRRGEIVWEWFFNEIGTNRKPDPVYRVNRIPRRDFENLKGWLY